MARKKESPTTRGSRVGKKSSMEKTTHPVAIAGKLYTVEVSLLLGPETPGGNGHDAAVVRTLQVKGDQTLAELHDGLLEAFGREEGDSYEFQVGHSPTDCQAARYVLPGAYEISVEDGAPAAGRVDQTTLDSLGLSVGGSFAYWFDGIGHWRHQVAVTAIEDGVPAGKYPRVIGRVGDSPVEDDDEATSEPGPQDVSAGAAADAACLVGEMHLQKGDFHKAIEAFSRALEARPTVDAHLGRARAYRALAVEDERLAEQLK